MKILTVQNTQYEFPNEIRPTNNNKSDDLESLPTELGVHTYEDASRIRMRDNFGWVAFWLGL